MICKALATKDGYEKGKEYDLPIDEAKALIIQGAMSFVAAAPAHNRQKAILDNRQWSTRTQPGK